MAVIPIISPVRRRFWLSFFIAVILLLVPLLWLPVDSFIFNDSALYTTGAWSLARGEGYRMVTHVGTPPITLYPPLTSAYLSLWFDRGANLTASMPSLHLGMILIGMLCGVLWFLLLARTGCPDWFAALTSLSFGLCINWVDMLVFPLSEPIFLLLILSLALFWTIVPRPDSTGLWWLTGIYAGLLYLARSAALGIVAGLGLLALFRARRGKWKLCVAYTIPVLVTLGWWQWMKRSAASTGYAAAFHLEVQNLGGWQAAAGFLAHSTLQYFCGIHWLDGLAPILVRLPRMPVLSQHGLSWLGWLVQAVIAGGFMICTARGFWHNQHPVLKWARLPVGAYLLQLCLWPFFLGFRGLVVVLPFAVRWAWLGFAEFTQARSRLWSCLLLAGLMANLIANVALTRKMVQVNYNLPLLNEVRETAAFIDRQVPPDAPVAVSGPLPFEQLYAATGRPVVEDYFMHYYLGWTFTPVGMENSKTLPRYLLSSRPTGHWNLLESFLKEHPGLMTVVFESSHGNYLLLRINEQEQLRLRQKNPQ